ncbi:MAG: glycerol kinase GlpK [Acidimicrobiia bacterium]|nr:glycerol kinase GlpK [Acidimicrobiia bacterium]MDH5421838.1 glycerol kinase GlpK [Acidimicrobiia bacterium]MDH5502427.1 glycerol kinase GlpK [Acidimicrobiia bacterium]
MAYIGSLDQGTTSTRFMLFDGDGKVVSSAQKEHEQIFPQAGWVEHNPNEIRDRVDQVIEQAMAQASAAPKDLAAIGITNQRETTMLWDRESGEPIGNAIVWQDVRTSGICNELAAEHGQDRFRARTGLPLATYFAGPKIAWLLDNTVGLRARAEAGEVAFGTMDSWVVWNLTGGPRGGLHITDVTNASRTLLMDLATLQWDSGLLEAVGVPQAVLPEIRPSVQVYGEATGHLAGVPIAGILGDQQAALFGQTCFSAGEAKNTYGTGCFMLLNTGAEPVPSEAGLLTTVAYQLDGAAPVYALEGSIAIAGALVQWLRDNLGIIDSADAIEALAASVQDNGGVYIVPAFNGLFAPYWRDDARGVIAGLTRYANRGHIARATLEAVAFQTKEVLDAMYLDSGVELAALKVDGGMVGNELLMQFQADLLDVPVVRPAVSETTALGAAYAAGLAVGFWSDFEALRSKWSISKRWEPNMNSERRAAEYASWKKAVTKSFDWV